MEQYQRLDLNSCDRERLIAEGKEVFFEGMKRGWASGDKALKTVDNPFRGDKCYTYRHGCYTLKDYFYADVQTGVSFGHTRIWRNFVPVWGMQYGGWYKFEVLEFLKRALFINYTNGIFRGGRGSFSFEGESHTLQYLNHVERNDFCNALGREEIIATSPQSGVASGTRLGEHHYHARLLV